MKVSFDDNVDGSQMKNSTGKTSAQAPYTLDMEAQCTLYYLYPHQRGMGMLTSEDKGDHYGFR